MNEIIKKVGTGIANPTPITNPVQEFMANTKGKRTVTITDELGVTLTMDITGAFTMDMKIFSDYSWLGRWLTEKPSWLCSFECKDPVITYPKGVQPINGTNN